MAADPLHVGLWPEVSRHLAERLGLHFPPARLGDLRRALGLAARELGMADGAACAENLLRGTLDADGLQIVVNRLTVGETYFRRGGDTFDALERDILPSILRDRPPHDRHVRVWSAGCCTGEEAYSLAILLRHALAAREGWRCSVVGTDLNRHFIDRAIAAEYGAWSFRDTPAGFRDRYFARTAAGRWALVDDIRAMVEFRMLNLAAEHYPSIDDRPGTFDVVFCRNVLMYFTAEQAQRIVSRLAQALRPGGWLAVAPCELSSALFADFVPVTLSGATFYRKPLPGERAGRRTEPRDRRSPPRAAHRSPAVAIADIPRATTTAAAPPAAVPRAPLRLCTDAAPALPDAFPSLARRAADEGRLDDALAWCDRWIAGDRLDDRAHYLKGIVLMERGRMDEARRALETGLYLRPDAVLVAFALGNLARIEGRDADAAHHFAHVVETLRNVDAAQVLDDREGLTAGQLSGYARRLAEDPR